MFRSMLLFFPILMALTAPPMFAQRDIDPLLLGNSFEIAGQVRAGSKTATVENVLVTLETATGATLTQTTTDSLGRFHFAGLGGGQYVVAVRLAGFKAQPQAVDLSGSIRRAQVFFELKAEETAAAPPADTNQVLDVKVPAKARKELEKGQSALREKKVEDALSHLEKAVSLYPDFFQAYLLLGITYREAQQWDNAERALRRTLELKPQTALALVELGEVYRRQKRFPEAEKVLLDSLQLNPGSWQGHFTLGRVYWEMGDPVKADPQSERALQLKPDYPETHLLAANICVRVGRMENALSEYEEYLRLAPSGEFANQVRALVQKFKHALKERDKK